MSTNTLSPELMNRREALRRMAIVMGAAMVGSGALLRGEAVAGKEALPAFSDPDRALLDEIAEAIIPETGIPGAKAARVGSFMAMMVTDCYGESDHRNFVRGMAAVNDASRAKFGRGFLEASPQERAEVVLQIDLQARAAYAANPKASPPHYFSTMKQLAVLGYFTSEIGCTKALRYVEVPGVFHADVPYHKGDPAWF